MPTKHGSQRNPHGKPHNSSGASGDDTASTGKDARKLRRKRVFGGNITTTSSSDVALPHVLDPLQFAAARAAEIRTMVQGLTSSSGARRAHQLLPRHMRRRAMSYNVKRLPVRLRARAAAEMASTLRPGDKLSAKERSRRHRRRASNLRAAYAKRSAKYTWLETHIWHAKRMHMQTRWGWRMAAAPCEKGVRAAHRALRTACTICDVSYTGTIELEGGEPQVLAVLREHLLPPPTDRVFCGDVEHKFMFHAAGGPQSGSLAVCPVTVLTDPAARAGALGDIASNRHARLWIQVHPATVETVETALRVTAGDAASTDPGPTTDPGTTKERVVVRALRSELLRFELRGPACTQVLGAVLDVCSAPDGGSATSAGARRVWEAVQVVGTPTQLRRHTVVGLTVNDPRLRTRCARTDAPTDDAPPRMASAAAVRAMAHPPAHVAASALWDAATRAALRPEHQQSTKDMHRRRQALLVPGAALPPQPSDARIPVLLVQQPGALATKHVAPPCPTSRRSRASDARHKQRRRREARGVSDPPEALHGWSGCHGNGPGCPAGYGAGWDLLLPAGWGMAFWLAFVHHGARAIALRERHTALLEMGVPVFPRDFPDTEAYRAAAEESACTASDKHKRQPRKCRVNYDVLHVPSPFKTDWKALVSSAIEGYHTARCFGGGLEEVLALLVQRGGDGTAGDGALEGVLVCVHVDVLHRGTAPARALVCAPTAADLRTLHRTPPGCSTTDPVVAVGPKHRADTAPARPVIGAVTSGGFSLARGRGFGVASVTATGLLRLAQAHGPAAVAVQGRLPDCAVRPGISAIVLVRELTSPQFRFARISVCSGYA
eukprot:m.618460 g.618460  ORF g.618460 m.618460 type:complete len:834 (-) comp22528_c0_seq12:133-2634(-)